MTLISARDSAHDFIVKFSPSVHVCSVVGFLTAEMAAQTVLLTMLMEQQTVTNPAIIHGCVPWQNNKSAMHAPSGLPPLPVDKSSY